ncbi:MAG: P27 family phage terminase small subunit [Actinomycetota bacterium]
MPGKKVVDAPGPPKHLKRRSRAFWRSVVATYELTEGDYVLLRSACETMDRLDEVRALIDEEGLTVPGSKGQLRPHPLLGAEKDARIGLARLLRELHLEGGPDPDPRVPR